MIPVKCVCVNIQHYHSLPLFSIFLLLRQIFCIFLSENVDEKGCDPVGGSVQFSEGQVHI